MSLIADILLVAASVGLAVYCLVLSRRLSRFTDLEKGVGGAVAVLSVQVDDLTRALKAAQATAQDSARALSSTTERAEDAARRLELHVAALHDLPPVPDGPPRSDDESGVEAGIAAGPPTEDEGATDDSPKPAFIHSARYGVSGDTGRPVEAGEPGSSTAGRAASLFSTQRRIQQGALG